MLNLEEHKTALKALMADTYDDLIRANSEETNRPFKLMTGKNDPTTFLLLNSKIGGLVRYVKDRKICV